MMDPYSRERRIRFPSVLCSVRNSFILYFLNSCYYICKTTRLLSFPRRSLRTCRSFFDITSDLWIFRKYREEITKKKILPRGSAITWMICCFDVIAVLTWRSRINYIITLSRSLYETLQARNTKKYRTYA